MNINELYHQGSIRINKRQEVYGPEMEHVPKLASCRR